MEKIGKRYPLFIGIARCARDDAHRSIRSYGRPNHETMLVPYTCNGWKLSWAGLSFSSVAYDRAREKNAFTPDTVPWDPAPPVVRPGAQFAVLEGFAFLDPDMHQYAMAYGETIVQFHGQSPLYVNPDDDPSRNK